MLETLTTSQKGFANSVSTTLETLVLHTVQKVVMLLEFVIRFSDAVIDNPGFITQVVALVGSKKRRLMAEQANMKEKCR